MAEPLAQGGGCPFHHGHAIDPDLVKQSVAAVAERERDLRKAFYSRLFDRYPAVKERFGAYSKTQQAQMMNQILEAVHDSVNDDTQWLEDHLASLGAQHQDWDVAHGMYAQLQECLLEALAEVMGEEWSPGLTKLWKDRLDWVADAMHGGTVATTVEMPVDDAEMQAAADLPTVETVVDYSAVNMLDTHTHTDDPEPLYEWLREESPLYWDPINEIWAVSRYKDVVYVSRRTDLFCSGQGVVPGVGLDVWPDEAMINLDGKAHTRQRGLIAKGFNARNVRELEAKMVEICDQLADRVQARGEADIVLDFARPLPMAIIADMLGYPDDMIDQVLAWTDVYSHAGCGPTYITEEVTDAFQSFCMFHLQLLEEKKANPGDDLLTKWLNAELDGHRLSEDKLMFEHNLLLVGGSETTRSAISMGMLELLRHPEQYAWLVDHVDDIDAMGAATEEMIRWSCPFVRMARTATQDTQMHGKTIKKGDQIIMLYPAANRDPRAFDNPQAFDVRRDPRSPALSFGVGKHYCIGAAVARLETRVMLQMLLRRFPNLTLADDAPERVQSCFIRGLVRLPVTFAPT